MSASLLPDRQFVTLVYQTPNGWRVCPDCEHEYPLTYDFFGSDCHYSDCFDIRCKTCRWSKRKDRMKRRALQKVFSR